MSGPLLMVAAAAGVVVLAAVAGVALGAVGVGPRRGPAVDRARLTAPGWGNAKDPAVRDLILDGRSAYDRLTLGQLGKKWVAAGERASVALFAPTLSGKTTSFMVPRLLEWEGALVATSAKADLVRLTLSHRQEQGPVWVFDPLGFLKDSGIASCHWSPLMGIRTYADALQAAAWITSTSTVENSGVQNQRFWDDNAKRMLAPLLFAAAQYPITDPATGEPSHERHIGQVGRWLQRGAASDPQVELILKTTNDRDARDALAGLRATHEQTRKNISSTAQIVLDPFAHTRTRSALTPTGRSGEDFDPARLLDEGGTLYVFAPEHEASEFKTLFETIINTVAFAAQERSARAGGVPIEPHHLLVALDEAANMAPLRKMPELASVGSSQGVVLLTVWQNMSQPESIYGATRCRTLMAGHNAKVFWGGIHDEATLKYVDAMCGEFEHRKTTRTTGNDRPTTSTSLETKRLAPPDFVQRLENRHVLVLQRNVKPLILKLLPWYQDDVTRTRIDPAVAAQFDSAFGAKATAAAGQVHRTAGAHD